MIKSIKNLNLPFVAELLVARSKKQEARSKKQGDFNIFAAPFPYDDLFDRCFSFFRNLKTFRLGVKNEFEN